jgi:hypothetical protein
MARLRSVGKPSRLANGSAGNIRLQDFDRRLWRQWGHRRDAYDILGSATSASRPAWMVPGGIP